MATVRPIAVVSPMRKPRKPKKKKTVKISPRKPVKTVHNSYCVSTDSETTATTGSPDSWLSGAGKRGRLCTMFDHPSQAAPALFGDAIPDHDRRILERMAAKMHKEIASIEMAHQAHILWEHERLVREKLQQEQDAEYNKYLTAKRQAEREYNEKKFCEVRRVYDWERKHLRAQLNIKDCAAANRIRTLEHRKNNEIVRKHELSQEKAENALVIMRQRKLEEAMWRMSLAENLKLKANNAEINKEILMRLQKKRTAIENQIHEEVQRQNWKDQKLIEMEHLANLKKQLYEKNLKMQRLQVEKENFLRESRQLAEATAKLRENLKRSLSPNIFLRGESARKQRQTYKSHPRIPHSK